METEFVYLNGRIVEAGAAMLSIFDVGLTHAAGLFETFRVYNGVPFRLDAHLDRLLASSGALEIPVGSDPDPWRDGVRRVLEANRLREARMRLTVTAGSTRGAGSTSDAAAGEGEGAGDADGPAPGTTLITATPMTAYPVELYRRGMTVCVSSYRQTRFDPTAGHKTLSYFPRLIGLREARGKQCGEALWFTTENLLAEGCVCSVFLVLDGKLLTPPLDTPVLPGVTRAVVLELARSAGIPAEERPLTIHDLLAAQEVFLTNTSMEVMPVARIERHAVADEKPGPITTRLRESYVEQVRRETGAAA